MYAKLFYLHPTVSGGCDLSLENPSYCFSVYLTTSGIRQFWSAHG